jgi:hypothetical protein
MLFQRQVLKIEPKPNQTQNYGKRTERHGECTTSTIPRNRSRTRRTHIAFRSTGFRSIGAGWAGDAKAQRHADRAVGTGFAWLRREGERFGKVNVTWKNGQSNTYAKIRNTNIHVASLKNKNNQISRDLENTK